MKMIIPAMLVLAIIVAVAWGLLSSRSRSKKIEFKTLDERMQWLSDQAVDMADRNFGTKLDYAPESVKSIDDILGKLHTEYVENQKPDGVKGLAMAYGAYIGNVIKRQKQDARWSDEPFQGEKAYSVDSHGRRMFVCAWCYNRIVNGDEDNVWFKYQASTSSNEASPQLIAR